MTRRSFPSSSRNPARSTTQPGSIETDDLRGEAEAVLPTTEAQSQGQDTLGKVLARFGRRWTERLAMAGSIFRLGSRPRGGRLQIQMKFNLGIVFVFAMMAIGISIVSITWVNHNTISEAERRVKLYIRSSWEIHNSKRDRLLSATEVLAQKQMVRDLLSTPENETLLGVVRQNLEATRIEQNLDVLNLLDSQGRVLLRTRPPHNSGDLLSDTQIVNLVLSGGSSAGGTVILERDQLEAEGAGLVERCVQDGGEARGMMLVTAAPVFERGELIGVIQMGSLLNGATEEVDRIRDAVFEDEQYKGKPLGTATIFMDDLRISTNVLNSLGEPAVGTRASSEVAERVLSQGLSWTGRAWVVDTWYLAQYDPIRDPDGNIIGMLYVGELEQKYLDMRTQALVLLLSVVLASMGFSFFVFYLITRGVLGPIEELAVATSQLANGDLAYRVAVQTGDEVGDLGRSFNGMAERLEMHRIEIEQQKKTLERLNKKLEVTNRNYLEMLGFVSHELKNPLASATLSLHTVKGGYLGELNPIQIKSLESVASSLDYFQDMIENYLDLSQLEKGELRVSRTSVHLAQEVVAPILAGLERGFQDKEMLVENCVPPELTVDCDRDLLRIIYDNLLSNAIKYGRQGGKVVLNADESESEFIFGVWNEGAGIPPEKVPLLFRKFSRLDSPEHAKKKGTGLGLFICKEIIGKHGGRIWVETADAGWTKFRFSLPKRVPGTPENTEGDRDG